MHLLMVDANALVRDWHLRSPILRQLQALIADHPDKVRAAVTEVVIAETVARYHRDADVSRREFATLMRKNGLARLVAADAVEAAESKFEQRCAEFEGKLRDELAAIGFEILKLPAVGHEELVTRATQRRPPNKADSGDGYRDTLNWFSIMREAEQLAVDDTLAWITEDKDFGTNGDLHEALSAELADRNIECPVRLQGSVDEAVDRVQQAVDPEQKDTARVRAKLGARSEKIKNFITEHVLNEFRAQPVSARSVAMPLTAANVAISGFADPVGAPELTVAGAVEGGARVRATWTLPATITYTDELRLLSNEVGDDDPVHVPMELEKDVLVVVDVITDRDANPQGGAIARVGATRDDPGRGAWALGGVSLRQVQRVLAAPQWRDLQRRQIEAALASMPTTDVSSVLRSSGVLEQLGRFADAARENLPRIDTAALNLHVAQNLARALRSVQQPNLTTEPDEPKPPDEEDEGT